MKVFGNPEYIEVSLEDYNNKTEIIKQQRLEIENLKKKIVHLEGRYNPRF